MNTLIQLQRQGNGHEFNTTHLVDQLPFHIMITYHIGGCYYMYEITHYKAKTASGEFIFWDLDAKGTGYSYENVMQKVVADIWSIFGIRISFTDTYLDYFTKEPILYSNLKNEVRTPTRFYY